MTAPTLSCLRLFRQPIRCAFNFDFASAGNSIAARIAMTAIMTSSSTSVKAELRRGLPSESANGGFAFIRYDWLYSFGPALESVIRLQMAPARDLKFRDN